MKNSKLIVFLKTLSNTEMKAYGRLIEANSSSKSADAIAFYTYLKKLHPNYPEEKIDKAVIAKKVYPKEVNGIKKIDNLMYNFWGFLEDFLVHQQIEKNPKRKEFLLLESLKDRKLDKYFFKKIDDLEKAWTKEKYVGAEHSHNMYRLQKMRLSHPNYVGKSNISYNANSLIKDIEQYYLATKTRLTLSNFATRVYINENDISNQNNLIPIDKLIDFSVENLSEQTVHVQLFTKIYNVFTSETKSFEEIQQLRIFFFEQADSFEKSEKSDVIIYLSQLFFELYKKNELAALNELFLINKFYVENAIITYRGFIDISSFQNIVNIACAAGELNWAEQFIFDYEHYLEAENEDTLALSKAALYLKKKNFEKALEILAQIKFQNVFNGAFARAIQLIAYYELDNYEEPFFNLTKSFNLFLLRNKTLADGHKKSFNNFISFAKKLEEAKTAYKPDIDKIEKEILACSEIIYQSWLLEKIAEFKN